jgi:hypothetical protein
MCLLLPNDSDEDALEMPMFVVCTNTSNTDTICRWHLMRNMPVEGKVTVEASGKGTVQWHVRWHLQRANPAASYTRTTSARKTNRHEG